MGQYHQNEKELLMLPIPQHHYVHRVKQFCTKQPDHNELTFSNYLKDVQFNLVTTLKMFNSSYTIVKISEESRMAENI